MYRRTLTSSQISMILGPTNTKILMIRLDTLVATTGCRTIFAPGPPVRHSGSEWVWNLRRVRFALACGTASTLYTQAGLILSHGHGRILTGFTGFTRLRLTC